MITTTISAITNAVSHIPQLLTNAAIKLMEVTPPDPIYTPEMISSGMETVMATVGPLLVACVPIMFTFIAIRVGPSLIKRFTHA